MKRYEISSEQLEVATHSPFIIHNDYRYNDKVIVLSRVGNRIVASDKPEYYKCDSVALVKDAFDISFFSNNKPTVYVEGRTDELYLNKAAKVLGHTIDYDIKWIGHHNNSGSEEFTGASALNQTRLFLVGRELAEKIVLLYDCDTNKKEAAEGLLFTKVMKTFESSKKMKKGIENALVLDSIELNGFYSTKIKEGDYGDVSEINTLDKMKLCNYICNCLNDNELKTIFSNLEYLFEELDELLS